ncbi:MAG: twin-arginine translocase TatA/TatE family subunit [Balneolaceae bacterium]
MGSFGGFEIVILVLVVLLFFGAKRIPELARGLGQGIQEFRKASDDIKKEIEKGSSDVKDATSYKREDSKEEETEKK